MNGIVSLQEFPVDPNAVPVPRVTPSAADLDQITNALGGGANSMLMLNSGINRGNDIAVQNQIIADRQSMSPLDFEAKYGSEVMRQMDMLAGADSERYLIENTDRGIGARVGDNANNAFTGLVGGIGDAGIVECKPISVKVIIKQRVAPDNLLPVVDDCILPYP